MVRVLTRVLGKSLVHLPWLAAAATVAACGGKALDIGFDSMSSASGGSSAGNWASLGGATTAATGGTLPELSEQDLAQVRWPEGVACEKAPDSPYVGTWKGHWPEQSGYVPNTLDAVLTIAGLTPDGTPCGTFRVGEGEPLPPASDPDAVYPPSLPAQSPMGSAGSGVGPGRQVDAPWPGYEYQLLNVIATEQRLAFGVAYNEILNNWCEIQTQVPGTYNCLPEWSQTSSNAYDPYDCIIQGSTLRPTHVPCFKLEYCSGRCFCYEGECTAQPAAALQFELHWDGGALEGSVNGGAFIFLDPIVE